MCLLCVYEMHRYMSNVGVSKNTLMSAYTCEFTFLLLFCC